MIVSEQTFTRFLCHLKSKHFTNQHQINFSGRAKDDPSKLPAKDWIKDKTLMHDALKAEQNNH